MDRIELFQRLGLALAIGLLIGLERGWRERDEADGSRTAGIRTFGLIGLLGGVWGAAIPALGALPLAFAGLAFAGAFTLFQWREGVARKDFSVTSTVAGMLVFALGVFAVVGDRSAAAGAGVTTLVLLAARTNLHDFLKRLSWPELRSAVVLLAMTFLMLPVLPDRTLDPFDAINPYELWLMVVLIAGVSFAGYAAVRGLGESRGLAVYSALGALVSSTTVTLNNARLATKSPNANAAIAAAICIAWMVSLTRMGIIAAVINRALLLPLAGPLCAATLILAIASWLFHASAKNTAARFDASLFTNPLDLGFVFGFGALLAVIIVVAKLLAATFGERGLLVLAALSGFADVDPITLASASATNVTLTPMAAAEAILLAGAANLLTKMIIALAAGGFKFGARLVLVGLLALGSGAASFFFAGGS